MSFTLYDHAADACLSIARALEDEARPHWRRVTCRISPSAGMVARATVECPACEAERTLPEVDARMLLAWARGEGLIQDLLPEVTRDNREGFQTGYCGPCWDRDFRPID